MKPRLRSRWSCLSIVLVLGCGAGDTSVQLGGAQDIGVFREILQKGGIPGPDTLDDHGFIHEHSIPLPAADCGDPICLSALLAVGYDWVWGSAQAVLMLGFNSPYSQAHPPPSKPVDIVVAVDTSASMLDDNRLGKVQRGLQGLLLSLGANDRMGIVAFDSSVETKSALHAATDPAPLQQAIASLQPHGSTNLHDGLMTALAMANDLRLPDHVASVVLITDGVPSKGVTATEQIIADAKQYTSRGILLSTVGLGPDADKGLLETLAADGSGSSYLPEDDLAVTEVFGTELTAALQPIAVDLRTDIEVNSPYALGTMALTTLMEPTTKATIVTGAAYLSTRGDFGTSYQGRRGGGTVVFYPIATTSPSGSAHEPLQVNVTTRYRSSDGQEYTRTTSEQGVWPERSEQAYLSHQAMRKGLAVYNELWGLQSAATLARCNHGCSLHWLERLETSTQQWLAAGDDTDIRGDLELARQFEGNLLRSERARDAPADKEQCRGDRGICGSSGDACAIVANPGRAVGNPWPWLVVLALLGLRRRTAGVVLLAATQTACGGGSEFPDNVKPTPFRLDIPPLKQLSVGLGHACGIDHNAQAWCWGRHLQTNNPYGFAWPTHVEGSRSWEQVSASSDISCGIDSDGFVYCWGAAPLGDDRSQPNETPQRVVDLLRPLALADRCAIDSSNQVQCWDQRAPNLVPGLGQARVLSGALGRRCAILRVDGTLWCWAAQHEATQVPQFAGARALSVGQWKTCAIDSQGLVWCWSGAHPPSAAPVLPSESVSVGMDHACAVSLEHDVWCWGNNYYGQLGDGTTDETGTAVQAEGVHGAWMVGASESATCALTQDGAVWCWGKAGGLFSK